MSKRLVQLPENSQIMEMLMNFRTPFDVTLTSATMKIETLDTVYMVSNKLLSFPELGFINQVKRFAQTCGLPKTEFDRKDIGYVSFQSMNLGTYKGVCEFDVNQAYWELARRSGYISERIHEKGLKVSKMARLVALGSLATVRRTYHFDGQDFDDDMEEDSNPITRSYFFHVSKQLDNIMKEIFDSIPRERKYFYWVDAFFVSADVESYVSEGLKRHGLEYKTKKIHQLNCYITKAGTKKIVATMIEGADDEKTDIYLKPFVVPNLDKKEADIRSARRRYKKFFG